MRVFTYGVCDELITYPVEPVLSQLVLTRHALIDWICAYMLWYRSMEATIKIRDVLRMR